LLVAVLTYTAFWADVSVIYLIGIAWVLISNPFPVSGRLFTFV